MINATATSGVESSPFLETQGTPQSALSSDGGRSDESMWKSIIDCLLMWRNDLDLFCDDDRPDRGVIYSAIDFAQDSMSVGQPAPTSMVPSGRGAIAFEWNTPRSTVIVELVDLGSGTITTFKDGKVAWRGVITRDPRTRLIGVEI